MSACRRSWKTVREVECQGRLRTALRLHRRSLAAAHQRSTFTMALEWRGWKRSQETSATPPSGPLNRQAEAEMENWEVNDVYNWTATQHFPDWCLCMWSEQSLICCGEGSDSQPGEMLITWILASRYSLRRTSKHQCVCKKNLLFVHICSNHLQKCNFIFAEIFEKRCLCADWSTFGWKFLSTMTWLKRWQT